MKPLEVIKTQAAKTFFIAELFPKQIRSPRLLFGFFLNHGIRLRKSPPYFCCVSRYVWQCLSLRVRLRSFSLNISGMQELSILLLHDVFFLVKCKVYCLCVKMFPPCGSLAHYWLGGFFAHTAICPHVSSSCPCLPPIFTLVLLVLLVLYY